MNSRRTVVALLAIAVMLLGLGIAPSMADRRAQTASSLAPQTTMLRPDGWSAYEFNAPSISATTTYTTYLPIVSKNYPLLPYVLTTIQLPAGSHPHGIALDIEGDRAFVGNHHSNTLTVLDTISMTVSSTITLPNADGPNGVAYHPTTDLAYIANRNTDNLSVVNPTTGLVVDTVDVGQMPDGVVVQGDLIYVANFGSDSVSVLDAQSNEVSKTLEVGVQPALMVNDDRGFVYLASYGDDRVYYLRDGSYFNVCYSVPAPYGLGFDSISYRLYVANRALEPTVTLIDVNPNHLAGTIDVGLEPFVVGVNPRTGHVFVVCGDQVKVYDRRDNALIVTLPVGAGAEEGVAVDPTRNLVYVTSGETDEVTVIQDIPTSDIAYVSEEGVQVQLTISDDRGWHVRSLATRSSIQTPSWRADGRHLVFAAFDSGAYQGWNVWHVEPGGQNLFNLTPESGGYEDVEPAWSPDGTQIAWRRDWRIWVMDDDGTDKTPLTPTDYGARTPKWSPDGQWIAFVATDDPNHEEDVFIVSPDGSLLHNVTNDPDHEVLEPSWSPDGTQIAFETNRDGNWEIYKANVEDPKAPVLTRLTDDPANDHNATWSPDGSQIAFVSDRGNAEYDYNVYAMKPDGTDQHRLCVAARPTPSGLVARRWPAGLPGGAVRQRRTLHAGR
jgi:YVTN family beta-propeller protein